MDSTYKKTASFQFLDIHYPLNFEIRDFDEFLKKEELKLFPILASSLLAIC